MKNPFRLLIPAAILTAGLGVSCAPLAIGAVGGLVGVWVIEDFKKGEGEILIAATPDRVFRAAEQVARSLPDTRNLEVVPGAYRIEWVDVDNVRYAVLVTVVPGSNEYSKLTVFAAVHGVRGRADLAQSIAEQIEAAL